MSMTAKQALVSGALLALCLPAHAALGGRVETIEAERVEFHAKLRTTVHQAYQVHEMTSATGLVVKQYAAADGKIFALSWQGKWRPDLQQLLGDYFDPFQRETASASNKRYGRRPLNVSRDDLVVRTGGHMHAFWGVAYLPQQLPSGINPADLQ